MPRLSTFSKKLKADNDDGIRHRAARLKTHLVNEGVSPDLIDFSAVTKKYNWDRFVSEHFIVVTYSHTRDAHFNFR